MEIEYVLKVDEIEVHDRLTPAPGPAFDPSQRAYVWVRYGGIEKLDPKLRRDDVRELQLVGGAFADIARPLGEPAWAKMHHTGLVFVEDPLEQPAESMVARRGEGFAPTAARTSCRRR